MFTVSFLAGGRVKTLGSIAVCVACLLTPLKGQEPDAFDAVVIKREAKNAVPMPRFSVDPKYLTSHYMPLHYLITQAFGVEDYQLSGIAGWMDSELYAIDAMSEKAVGRARMMSMLRDLLVTRFELRFHHETREVPVFALTVDKHGTKLATLSQGEEVGEGRIHGEHWDFPIGSSIQDLVRHLNSRTGPLAIGRPVVDRTGLRGLYKIRLTFLDELNPDGQGGRMIIDYPSALIDQLGLRLQPTKAAIDIMVIDRASRPKSDE